MNTAAIQHELLRGHDDNINRRRKIVLLSALGLVDFALISLYQSGVIKRLPDLPFRVFDSNQINAAEDAYQLGAPDGTISALTYASAMVLATWKGGVRAGRKPWHDVALGAAVTGNAGGALYYLGNMIFKQRKACLYCLAGAAINLASLAIVLPLLKKNAAGILRL